MTPVESPPPPRVTRFIQHASYAAIVNKAKLDIKSDHAALKIPVKNMFCLCNILRILVYKKRTSEASSSYFDIK